MWRRAALGLFLLCGLSAACTSIDPRPPTAPGVIWTRDVLAQGAAPNTLTTARATFSGTRNLVTPLILGSDFRYRMELTVDRPDARHTLLCAQHEDRTYRCGGDGAFVAFELGEGCLRSRAVLADGRSWTVDAWFHGRVHVGFLVYEGDRLLAAIDTDHQWVRPVWVVEQALPPASRLAVDTLAYVLNDAFSVDEGAGRALLCGDLAWARRHPR